MSRIAVIDYDAGNTKSVMNSLEYIGQKLILTNDRETILNCDKVVFPGVGAYYDAVKKAEEYNIKETIDAIVSLNKPFLGICLGMQLLFEESSEALGSDQSSVKGFGLLEGSIKHFPEMKNLKIPHMGWNSVSIKKRDSRLFHGIDDNSYFYFVHSYYLDAADRDCVAGSCSYGIDFDCAVEKDNIFGCQFHPEKSSDTGLKLLKNFCEL